MKDNWRRGQLLHTPRVERMSAEERERMQGEERKRIFSGFSGLDQGRTRELVAFLNSAHPHYERNAVIIENAPELLGIVKELLDPDGTSSYLDVLHRASALVEEIEFKIKKEEE